MPFKSEAQRRKMYGLMKEGKISKAVIEEWEEATGKRHLPERLPIKPKGRPGRPKSKVNKLYRKQRSEMRRGRFRK